MARNSRQIFSSSATVYGEPVYLLELHSHSEVPGCNWKGLRAFMLEGDHTLYKVLGGGWTGEAVAGK